jgi:hypothetical protein
VEALSACSLRLQILAGLAPTRRPRDSFTIPRSGYATLDAPKQRLVALNP